VLDAYERANPPETLWGGWARYWRNQDAKVAGR
jgi:hypothetical protein